MRVFIDYKKKNYPLEVEESITIGSLKDVIEKECMMTIWLVNM